jgi:hypothetical protein
VALSVFVIGRPRIERERSAWRYICWLFLKVD